MMENNNRDLLVVLKSATLSEKELEREFLFLNKILSPLETINNYAVANEIIDLNNYKIIKAPSLIAAVIHKKMNKSFVFISNKN